MMATQNSKPSASDLTAALKGASFPSTRQSLIDQAKKNEASKEVMGFLENLEDLSYASMTDVTKKLGSTT